MRQIALYRPKTAAEAIRQGTEELHNSNPKAAVELFQRALELPGRGAFRMQGSPREYRFDLLPPIA